MKTFLHTTHFTAFDILIKYNGSNILFLFLEKVYRIINIDLSDFLGN